jgi:cobalt-zinc-cadmium efflux system outer membrane protein
MYFRIRAGAPVARALLALAFTLHCAAGSAPLTLEEAWRLAESSNPALRTAQAALYSAQGQLADSRAPLWNNPTALVELGRTRVPQAVPPEDSYNTWRAGVSQTFELSGQQGFRRDAAVADLAAYHAAVAEVRAVLRAEVEQRFVQVLALQLRTAIERETATIVDQAATVMGKRLDAGEVNRLDSNLARVEAERARNMLIQLDEQITQARAELATVLQLPAGELPEVSGELRRHAGYSLDELLAAAALRRQLESLARREDAARSRLALERASRTPDLTVELFAGRDGPSDLREKQAGLAFSLPLPIFRRNETGIGRATSELTQVQIERQAAERDAAAAVRAQWRRVAQLESRANRLREGVVRTPEENQRLSGIALKEGEIGTAELLLVNRQLAETRRDLLDAETELRLARVALERAAGWPAQESTETK